MLSNRKEEDAAVEGYDFNKDNIFIVSNDIIVIIIIEWINIIYIVFILGFIFFKDDESLVFWFSWDSPII